MFICHKLVASNGAEVLQTCYMSDMHATSQCRSCQHRERLCAGEYLIQSYLSLLVSQTPSGGSDDLPPPPLHEAVATPMKIKCMQSI